MNLVKEYARRKGCRDILVWSSIDSVHFYLHDNMGFLVIEQPRDKCLRKEIAMYQKSLLMKFELGSK